MKKPKPGDLLAVSMAQTEDTTLRRDAPTTRLRDVIFFIWIVATVAVLCFGLRGWGG